VVGRVRNLEFWGRADDTQTVHFPYTVQSATWVLLHSVITNVPIYAFCPTVLSFKHSYAMRRNDILHADGGLFLHPTALTGFVAAGLDFHSYVF
jgi:hypothetical protein